MASNGLCGAVREIRTLLIGGVHPGLTDRELLDRFSRRDDDLGEAAFAALVSRHGPMVWGVCHRVLRDPTDAVDAFQATFLVLVRKASSVRVDDSLGPWLHGVSLRVAQKARTVATRRRRRERTNVDLPEPPVVDPELNNDVIAVIDEELGRLPARYGSVLVFCLLQGLTHEEAAARLACPVGTVRSRLARGRELLRARLTRRGLAPAGCLFVPGTSGAVAVENLTSSTVRAAVQLAAGRTLAGMVPAGVIALLKGVDRSMMIKKIALAAALVTACLLGATGVVTLAAQGQSERPSSTPSDLLAAIPVESIEIEQKTQDPNPPPTGADFDDFPAFVVKSIPATGSTDVDPSIKEIKVVYSKNMQNGTWSWSQLGKESFPKLDETGKIHYENDKRTCVLPVKLEPGKTYAIFCNSPRFHNFKDKEGSPAVPYMLVFRTRK